MDAAAKAAFITAQAACMAAELVSMMEQNRLDIAAGRFISYQPHEFQDLPNKYQLGHNDVLAYLQE